MVWIKIITGDGILNEQMIERISWEEPPRQSKTLDFFAHGNGDRFLIYSLEIPSLNARIARDELEEEDFDLIDQLTESIINKMMFYISEAKNENYDQIINFRDKFYLNTKKS